MIIKKDITNSNMTDMIETIISVDEVKKHNKEEDCWIIIEDKVYNVSKFMEFHPAGKNVIF